MSQKRRATARIAKTTSTTMSTQMSVSMKNRVENPQWYVYQCPVCRDWQMDYDINMAMETWGEYRIEEGQVVPHMKPMHDALEQPFLDHIGQEHPEALARFRATGVLS